MAIRNRSTASSRFERFSVSLSVAEDTDQGRSYYKSHCVRALSPQDPRFNAEVDLITGYKTQSILCLPIKNHRDEVRLHSLERWILCRVGKLAFDDLQWI